MKFKHGASNARHIAEQHRRGRRSVEGTLEQSTTTVHRILSNQIFKMHHVITRTALENISRI